MNKQLEEIITEYTSKNRGLVMLMLCQICFVGAMSEHGFPKKGDTRLLFYKS